MYLACLRTLVAVCTLLAVASPASAATLLARPQPDAAVIGTADEANLREIGRLRNDHGVWRYVSDGTRSGWLRHEPEAVAVAPRLLRAQPRPGAPVVHRLAADAPARVLRTVSNPHGSWAYVDAGAAKGWLPADQARGLPDAEPPRANAPPAPETALAVVPADAAPAAPAPAAEATPETAPPAPAPAVAPAAAEGRVLRAAPEPDAEILARVPADATVDLLSVVTNDSGEWWQVRAGEHLGWLRLGAPAPEAATAAGSGSADPQAGAPVPAAEPIGLRARPRADAPVAALVPPGEKLSVITRTRNAEGDWLFVRSGTVSGWLARDEAPADLR